MRKVLFIILSAVLMTLAASCGQSRVSRSLSHVEEIMEEHPDSALAILDSLPAAELRSDADRALHALLLTQAQIKNGYTVDSDTLIRRATAYYSDRDPSPRLMKSLFYDAKVKFNSSRLSEAIVPALEARDLAIEYADPYWQAKSAELIADIYNFSHHRDDDIAFRKETIDCYRRANKIRNERFAMCDLAIALRNTGHQHKSIHILDSIINIANSSSDDRPLAYYAYEALLPAYFDLGYTEEAVHVVNLLDSLNTGMSESKKMHSYKARIAIETGRPEVVEKELSAVRKSALTNIDKASYYMLLVSYYKATGEYVKAMQYTDSVLSAQTGEVSDILKQSVIKSQKRYSDERAEVAEKQSEKRRQLILIILICTGVMAVIAYLTVKKIIKRKNEAMDLRIGDIKALAEINKQNMKSLDLLTRTVELKKYELQNLNFELEVKDRQINRLKTDMSDSVLSGIELNAKIERLFKEKWSILNMLCEQYYDSNETQREKIALANRVKTELDRLRSKESVDALLDSVDEFMDGLVTKLRKQCSFMSEADVIFVGMIFAGFSPRTICCFTGISFKYYYTKRKRIATRILESGVLDSEEFTERLK